MKLLLFSIFSVCSILAYSQNFSLFNYNQVSHYKYTSGSKDFIYSLKYDSLDLMGSDSLLFPYEQVYFKPNDIDESSLDLNYKCLERASWFGRECLKQNNGVYKIVNEYDTIYINSLAFLGDTWLFSDNSSTTQFMAEVTNVYESSVLGVTDSIKEITINLYNDNDNIVANANNGKKILISKNFGLYETIDLLNFPTASNPISYITIVGNELMGTKPLENQNIYDYQIGDILVYQYNNSNKEYIYINDKLVTTDSVSYNYDRIDYAGTSSPSFTSNLTLKYPINLGQYGLTGRYYSENSDYERQLNGVMINYLENQVHKIDNYKLTDLLSTNCWASQYSFGNHEKTTFGEKIGLMHNSTLDWYEYFDIWGGSFIDYVSQIKTLITYNGMDTTVGSYIIPFSSSMISVDNQRTCTSQVTASVPNLGYDSVRWSFGDGTFSNQLNPTHTYASVGTYNLSIQIYSKFGDTLLHFQNQIIYGDNETHFPIQEDLSHGSVCNEFIFQDLSEQAINNTWTLSTGDILTGDSVSYMFSTPGTYQCTLNNDFGVCSRESLFEIIVTSTIDLVEPTCEPSNSYNLLYFQFNGYQLPSLSSYEKEFYLGCNSFSASKGQNVEVLTEAAWIDAYYDDWGNYIEDYYGYSYDIWVDYNNDGIFDLSTEKVISGASSGGYDTQNFTVSNIAISNTFLRMRVSISSPSEPCTLNAYDFAILINEASVGDISADFLNVYPNPTNDYVHVEYNLPFEEILLEDLSGRIVLKSKSKDIDIRNLAPGQYLININGLKHKLIIG